MHENKDQSQPIVFNPQQVFAKTGHFTCQSLGFPSTDERIEWMRKSETLFNGELEDLMRKYKVVQVVASIYEKL